MSGPFAIGDRVVLVDTKSRHYLVTLRAGAEFHTHSGYIADEEIVGRQEGAIFKATKGMLYTALRPTLEDFVLLMPRGAQVIYPKDLGPILCSRTSRRAFVCSRAAWVRGRSSMAMLRCGAIITGYEIRDDFANRARANVGSFLGEEALSRYDVQQRDCYEGIDEDIDRVVLDLPEPWQVVPHAETALCPGGVLCAYTPSVVQVMQLREALRGPSWIEQRTVEVLQRSWHVDGQAVRPDHRMVAHTGFLTVARFLGSHS